MEKICSITAIVHAVLSGLVVRLPARASRVPPRRAMRSNPCGHIVVLPFVGVNVRLLFFHFLAPLVPPALWFLGSEPKFAEPSAPPQGAAQSAAAKLVSDPNNQRGGGERVGPKMKRMQTYQSPQSHS